MCVELFTSSAPTPRTLCNETVHLGATVAVHESTTTIPLLESYNRALNLDYVQVVVAVPMEQHRESARKTGRERNRGGHVSLLGLVGSLFFYTATTERIEMLYPFGEYTTTGIFGYMYAYHGLALEWLFFGARRGI